MIVETRRGVDRPRPAPGLPRGAARPRASSPTRSSSSGRPSTPRAVSRACADSCRSTSRRRRSSPSTTSSPSARSRRCAEHGLEVPDDVALVCFDDIDYASRLYPFLTVMEQPAETFGTLGTQLLLERMDGRARSGAAVVVLPAEFIVRRSCGAAGAADVYGGVEAGGSKWRVRDRRGAGRAPRRGDDPDDDAARRRSRASSRSSSRRARSRRSGSARSGRSTGGRRSPTWGHITTTPKPGWAHTDVGRRSAGACPCRSRSTRTSTPRRSASTAGARRRGSRRSATSRSAPGSAAARWSRASSSTGCCTRSSATCASRASDGRPLRRASARTTATAGRGWRPGARSRRAGDGPRPSSTDDAVWALEARYLALGLVSVISVLTPERIVIGGGVMSAPGLIERVRGDVAELLNGYLDAPASARRSPSTSCCRRSARAPGCWARSRSRSML